MSLALALVAPADAQQLTVQAFSSELSPTGAQVLDQINNNSATGTLLPGQIVSTQVSRPPYGVVGDIVVPGESDAFYARSEAIADYGALGIAAASLMVNNTRTAQTRSRQVLASASSEWYDVVTVGSGGAALGSLVDIRVDIAVRIGSFVSIASPDGLGVAPRASGLMTFTTTHQPGSGWCIQVGVPDACGAASALNVGLNVFSFETQLRVGDVRSWTASLNGLAEVAIEDASSVSSASVGFAALDTAHTYFTVLTPGASLQWASGHDYSMPAPVPEPETYAMLLAGLGLLAFVRRRRQRGTAAA